MEPIIPFCDVLQTQNFTSPAYADGLYANFGIETTLTAFLTGIAETDPSQSATVHPPADDATGTDPDTLSWTFQYCSEFGSSFTALLYHIA